MRVISKTTCYRCLVYIGNSRRLRPNRFVYNLTAYFTRSNPVCCCQRTIFGQKPDKCLWGGPQNLQRWSPHPGFAGPAHNGSWRNVSSWASYPPRVSFANFVRGLASPLTYPFYLPRSTDWVDKGGKRHMVMRFYLKGAYAQGTVNLEVYEVSIPS